MIRLYLSIIVLFLAFQGFSQEINGRAYYTAMVKLEKPKLTEKQLADPKFKDLAEQLTKPFIDELVLEFTQDESVLKKLPKLEKPDPKKGKITISMSVMGDEEIVYKNLKKNKFLNAKELYGKKFLIDDALEDREWQLGKETKTIGDYVCFKATYLPEPEVKESLWLYSDDENKKNEIIAWYTPQIPVKNGPARYDGLPGLILEVEEGRRKYVCTKIVLNPDDAVEIKKPVKGKKVDQEKFDAILEEKSKDMMETFKTKKRRD